MKPIKFCSVEGCNKKFEALSFCNKHYKRFKAHGDASVNLRPTETNEIIDSGEDYVMLVIDSKQHGESLVLVDKDDYPLVKQYRWFLDDGAYPITSSYEDGKKSTIRLHRLLMNPPDGIQVDHQSGDTLDCRRSNMRLCTHSQNIQNRSMLRNNTSGYKGVSWAAHIGKWRADITANKKRIFLGHFDDPKKAYQAYCIAAERHHGEFSRLK